MPQSAEDEITNVYEQEKKFLTLRQSESKYLLVSFNYLK